MFSKALNRLTCAFSLLLVCVAALGSEVSDYRDALDRAKSRQEFRAVLENPPEVVREDGSLGYYAAYSLELLESDGHGSWTQVRDELVQEIDAYLQFHEGPPEGQLADPSETAKEILNNPIYIDAEQREGRNWIDKAGTRIGERILEWLNQFQFNAPDMNVGIFGGSLGQGLTIFMWVLLLVIIGLVLFFVLRHFSGVGRRKRRVGGILEDDEPERTADQWLARAEELEAEGKIREAVRCLYLACLVRYDDGRVARFRRHETNWEHLYRIEASPTNPAQIDFRTATQRFDKIWYGYQVKGPEDAAEFKEVYKRLCEALQIKTAA
jgi:hypothetical protein